jgi:hypothetical protein
MIDPRPYVHARSVPGQMKIHTKGLLSRKAEPSARQIGYWAVLSPICLGEVAVLSAPSVHRTGAIIWNSPASVLG